MNRVGVLSTGIYLPEEIRKNDWWPKDTVSKWKSKRAKWEPSALAVEAGAALTDGQRHTLDALKGIAGDPFQGSTERRIIGKGQLAAEMDAEAAKMALANAGITPDQVDALLCYTMAPDYVNAPSSCIVHDLVGLRQNCMALNVDTVCNSFQTQLDLAEQLINGGRAKYVLAVQSSAISRFSPWDRAFTTAFGDGAAAVVIGRVSDEHGVLSREHRVDGSLHKGLVCTGPGGAPYWEQGPLHATSLDEDAAENVFMHLADRAREVVLAALKTAKLEPTDVDFFACHQATAWLRGVVQKTVGLTNARALDSHSFAGTISAANIPLILHTAERDGLLKTGDVVAMYSGGTGITWSATIMKWGR